MTQLQNGCCDKLDCQCQAILLSDLRSAASSKGESTPINMVLLLRQLCLIGLPISLCAAVLAHFYFEAGDWAFYAYILTLTANIGYFTNFIAIKMLFKPYQATAFGRQGLIPKNKQLLSKALSQTLSQHFLSDQHWHDYFVDAKLLDKVLDQFEVFVINWLSVGDNKKQALLKLEQLITTHENQVNELAQQLQSHLIDHLSQSVDLNQAMDQLIDWLEQAFENDPVKMLQWVEPVFTAIAENVPQIAQQLHANLDLQIEKQSILKRGIAKAAKWSVDVSDEDIKNYLFHLLASQAFRQTLFNGLHSLVKQYKNKPSKRYDFEPLSKQLIENLLADAVGRSSVSCSTKSTQAAKQKSPIDWADLLINYLRSPQNQQSLERVIMPRLKSIVAWAKLTLASKKMQKRIYQGLVTLINRLKLDEAIEQKASEFSAQKMHQIFDHILSKHLIFIELLGALLGGLSGLALINIHLLGIIATSLVMFFALEAVFTKIRLSKIRD
jgi:uncharacterized membrane protein YheB (UPF0754 family)